MKRNGAEVISYVLHCIPASSAFYFIYIFEAKTGLWPVFVITATETVEHFIFE